MAAISLRRYGGMAPSANAKGLDEHVAVLAKNIDLRFSDFRPMPAADNIATATAGSTLYRFEADDAFITKNGEVNFVRGPIPNDATERTYYTGDGTPKVTDLTQAVRELGVPAPSAAPTVAVNKVDEFTREDSVVWQGTSLSQMITVIRTAMSRVWSAPSEADLAPHFVLSNPDAPWEAQFVIPGTLTGGTFTPTNPAHRNLLDARFGYYLETTGDTTVAKVQITTRGSIIAIAGDLATQLATIDNPQSYLDGGNPDLLTADQCASIVNMVTAHFDAATQKKTAVISRVAALRSEFVTLATSTDTLTQSDREAVQAFYARTEVVNAVSAAKTAAAIEIKNAVYQFNQLAWEGGA